MPDRNSRRCIHDKFTGLAHAARLEPGTPVCFHVFQPLQLENEGVTLVFRNILIVLTVIALCSLAAASAQEAKKEGDRLSGVVKMVDKAGMKITITPRNSSVERIIMYDTATKFYAGDKEGKIDDVQDGMRIVAVGKFEGVNLKAAEVRVRLR
jgi:hypothetical protein